MLGIGTFGSRKPGRIGCRLRNTPSAKRGEACMRSRRAPAGRLPMDFMCAPYRSHPSSTQRREAVTRVTLPDAA